MFTGEDSCSVRVPGLYNAPHIPLGLPVTEVPELMRFVRKRAQLKAVLSVRDGASAFAAAPAAAPQPPSQDEEEGEDIDIYAFAKDFFNKSTAAECYARANELAAGEDWGAATRLLRRATQLDPGNARYQGALEMIEVTASAKGWSAAKASAESGAEARAEAVAEAMDGGRAPPKEAPARKKKRRSGGGGGATPPPAGARPSQALPSKAQASMPNRGEAESAPETPPGENQRGKFEKRRSFKEYVATQVVFGLGFLACTLSCFVYAVISAPQGEDSTTDTATPVRFASTALRLLLVEPSLLACFGALGAAFAAEFLVHIGVVILKLDRTPRSVEAWAVGGNTLVSATPAAYWLRFATSAVGNVAAVSWIFGGGGATVAGEAELLGSLLKVVSLFNSLFINSN